MVLSPSPMLTIRYLDLPTESVPVSARPASIRRAGVAAAAIAGAALVIGLAAAMSSGGAVAVPASSDGGPVPGEFRLAPGLGQPPGYVLPVAPARVDREVPGEFRLAPGLGQPPGYSVGTSG